MELKKFLFDNLRNYFYNEVICSSSCEQIFGLLKELFDVLNSDNLEDNWTCTLVGILSLGSTLFLY